MHKPSSRFPSRALRRFHVALVVSGITFCFGFALYVLLVKRGPAPGESLAGGGAVLAAVFVAGGVFLSVYLRSFLKRSAER